MNKIVSVQEIKEENGDKQEITIDSKKTKSIIQFSDVSKHYREGDEIVKALDRANFEIADGDFVAICGPSGSGKSTLLSILGVLNTPTDGKVLIDSIDVYSLSPEKKADFRADYIGFIFQAFQLIPYLTALENVMLPLTVTGRSNAEQKSMAEAMLIQVGLESKINKLPNQLSGGEIQRVAIARALVNEPNFLLADEPTGNLDSKNSEDIMRLLVELNKKGKTIIMVTHEDIIAHYAHYIIQLHDGHIV